MIPKKVIFRADGNSEIGLGHLFRLFSLVESIKNTFDFIFLTNENSTLSVIPEDYNVNIIPSAVNAETEPQWISDKYSSKEYIIIADGYQFNSDYQRIIKENGFKLIYIDDLTTEYMYADLVINHSPQVEKENFTSESYTKFALGMDYVMVRPSFLKVAKDKREIGKIDTIFVNFGGADKFDLTLKVTKVLVELSNIIKIKIILGAAYSHQSIFEFQVEHPEKISIYKNLTETELLNIMQSCNFAIVPASTVLFELFCVKMPIYSGYFAENQKNAFESLKKLKLVFGDGDLREINFDKLLLTLKELIHLTNHQEIIENQMQSIDGKQHERFMILIKEQLQ